MNKIKLEIVGLSYSQTQSGAYALILTEVGGKRKMPIIIGGFEAQAIAIEIEKMPPPRPLTHDLFKSFAQSFNVKIVEVIIYNLSEGIFYAKMVCESNGKTVDIDARTSDAIAIAVRFNCPIYTFDNILSQAGIFSEETGDDDFEEKEEEITIGSQYDAMDKEEIQTLLAEAIANEDYELAQLLSDELKKKS